MERKEFQLNEVIFNDGVYQNWMYSICEGSVDIYAGFGTSEEKKLTTLTKGQSFGEIGMIAVMPRTATAVAAENHVVLDQISSEDLNDYLKSHPENLQPVMSSVSRRIRELTEDLSGITQMANILLGEEKTSASWLNGHISKLFGNLKAKKAARNEFVVKYKRQQALSGEASPVIHFAAGDVIFRAGEEADCMYEIMDGSVGIYSDYQTEDAHLLTKLYTDAVFGEMGILDDMPRSATAVCLTACTIKVVTLDRFVQFFQNKPMKVLEILQQMCVRLRDLTETYTKVCGSLEEMLSMKEEDYQEDEVQAKLENIRQTQYAASMYDCSTATAMMYGYCK